MFEHCWVHPSNSSEWRLSMGRLPVANFLLAFLPAPSAAQTLPLSLLALLLSAAYCTASLLLLLLLPPRQLLLLLLTRDYPLTLSQARPTTSWCAQDC